MMRKVLTGMFIAVAIVGIRGFILLKSTGSAPEEYIVYNKANQITTIEGMLEGVNRENIRDKKDLIMEKSIGEIQEPSRAIS